MQSKSILINLNITRKKFRTFVSTLDYGLW